MKTKLMTLLILAIGFVTIRANAQLQDESRVKILPTSRPGVLKLIHAITTDEPVSVKFIDDQGVVESDEIIGSFPTGLSKKYDVRNLGAKDFRMEITSAHLSVTYHIVRSKDKKTFTPYLEKTIHNYELAEN
jgi:hypothetical protein